MSDKKFGPSDYWKLYRSRLPGEVIILNGTSSSGKGSIVAELQDILEKPFMHFSIDTFLNLLPAKIFTSGNDEDFGREIIHILKGFYKSVAFFVAEGNNVIVDTVLQDGIYDLKLLLPELKGSKSLFVGIKCELLEIERRERDRGDRQIGLAKYQFPRVHSHELYDLELDTTHTSADKCAQIIKEHMQTQGFGQSIEKLYQRHFLEKN